MDLIKTFELTKNFSLANNKMIYAVNDINLTIKKGQSFGLIGESGSGKSTLGQMLSLLQTPSSGKILYNNKDIFQLTKDEEKEFRKKVQIIFQNPYESLNPKMTIKRIIEEPLIIHKIGKTKTSRDELINEIRTLCGLDSSVLNKYPSELSGGQRQRVSIASSMILKPEFLILDEAVSSLDVLIQAQILNILKLMQKSLKVTYLFISHDLNVVSYICDVIGVMYMGQIIEQAPTQNLLEHKIHPYTKALFSAAFSLDDTSKKKIILNGELPDNSRKIAGCPFASRCNICKEICKKEKPRLEEITKNHFVACHFAKSE